MNPFIEYPELMLSHNIKYDTSRNVVVNLYNQPVEYHMSYGKFFLQNNNDTSNDKVSISNNS